MGLGLALPLTIAATVTVSRARVQDVTPRRLTNILLRLRAAGLLVCKLHRERYRNLASIGFPEDGGFVSGDAVDWDREPGRRPGWT